MSPSGIKVSESTENTEGLQDELRAFDSTNTGVKGLVDARIEIDQLMKLLRNQIMDTAIYKFLSLILMV